VRRRDYRHRLAGSLCASGSLAALFPRIDRRGRPSQCQLVIEVLFQSGYPQQRQGAFSDLSDAFPGDALDGRDLIEGMRLVAVEPEPGSQDGRLYAGKVTHSMQRTSCV
jgi:hypothetical protein